MFKKFETYFAGKKLVIETGKMACFSNGSCLVRYEDTAVLVNATMSKEPRDGIDFLPLSVDYEEKLYAIGKIPGSFMKREGKATDKAILVSRAIDRPLRPLFPHDYRNDTSIHVTVMCVDPDVLPEIPAMIGASIALNISDIPFDKIVGGIKVGLIDENLVLNPNLEERAKSRLDLTIAATYDKVCMIEAGASEVDNETMIKAIKFAHEEIKKLCVFIEDIRKEIGKPKSEYKSFEVPKELINEISTIIGDKLSNSTSTTDKNVRDVNIDELKKFIKEEYIKNHTEEDYAKNKSMIAEAVYKLQKKAARSQIINNGMRPDGRGLDEIRPLSAETHILERTHGSALFSRGQTQVLSVVTLGTMAEEQNLDGLDEEKSKNYIHHYNFPPYSVGESRSSRGPGRREIGHGALAEKALVPVLPSTEEFPYTIRVVSEILSSNGSTSQGSICASTLALMDAGVPIKSPVAGISTGLFTKDDNVDDYIMVTDIQGIEDFFGDMDFKVAGTKKGITAIQVDIKIDGLSYEVIEEAFEKTYKARCYILDEIMLKEIAEPRKEISKYAPKIITITINPDKIRDVIGSGGKIINKIIEDTGVKIDIEDTGKIFIAGADSAMVNKAISIIEGITRDVEINAVYLGKVTKIIACGAIVEVMPGKEGLLHISKMSKVRINKVEEVLNLGDNVMVKVIDIDKENGKFSLIANDLVNKEG
ncbi:MAG: polyribonucleotide nucleotidyltransferase [Clostridia bacterium]|nr:polyribonucleotide nucleotidyltransferase [Clostridia bacterium]MDD4386695.1 polyribonucleotide nucleotidyltransferase [Clostridia bacterium]